ncbi:MAG TPA: hypothetical protein VF013_09935 [Candidatus Limnocylindria bacterium]
MDRPDIGLLPEAREEHARFAWLARLLGRAMAAYVRLVARTCRVSGPSIGQEQVIFAFWHEANLATAVAVYRLRRDNKGVVFSTRGFRGVVMNTMLRGLGSAVVTLPDVEQRRGAEAASLSRLMARIGRSGWSLFVSCDGPWGPHRVAKPGVLIVARESGLPVRPWAVALRPAWRLRGRWDRQLLPLPFCQLRVEEGELLRVGERERIKPLLPVLQAALDDVADRADHRMERAARGK